jgi:STE24 endopeptidase
VRRLNATIAFAGFLSLATLAGVTIAFPVGNVSSRDAPPAAAQQGAPEGATATDEKGQRTPIKGYALPPEKYRQAVEYSRARYRLYFIGVFYDLLVLLALLGWRVAPRLGRWAERASSRRSAQVAVYAPLFLLALGVLELPAEIYGHWLSLTYQQSFESWRSWSWDWTKGQLLQLIGGTFLVWVLYGIIRRSPGRWPFYFWLASLPIIVFTTFIAPLAVDPLFYKFEPLARTQPALVKEISKVVERAGLRIPPDRMFEMKASQKLKSVDAYVTGIGASKRVVVWDTTISRMTVPETLSVFGHEMGHYVLGHIPKGIVFFSALLFVFLYLGYWGLGAALHRWGARWDIHGADDWASLPVLLLLFSLFSFVASPAINGFSRYQEHQADVYGLEVIHGLVPDSQQATARSFQVLGEIDLADPSPSPFIKFWLYSHPPLSERIAFALDYDPWSKGQQPEFVKP